MKNEYILRFSAIGGHVDLPVQASSNPQGAVLVRALGRALLDIMLEDGRSDDLALRVIDPGTKRETYALVRGMA